MNNKATKFAGNVQLFKTHDHRDLQTQIPLYWHSAQWKSNSMPINAIKLMEDNILTTHIKYCLPNELLPL